MIFAFALLACTSQPGEGVVVGETSTSTLPAPKPVTNEPQSWWSFGGQIGEEGDGLPCTPTFEEAELGVNGNLQATGQEMLDLFSAMSGAVEISGPGALSGGSAVLTVEPLGPILVQRYEPYGSGTLEMCDGELYVVDISVSIVMDGWISTAFEGRAVGSSEWSFWAGGPADLVAEFVDAPEVEAEYSPLIAYELIGGLGSIRFWAGREYDGFAKPVLELGTFEVGI